MDLFIDTFEYCFKKASKIYENALQNYALKMEKESE